MKKSEVMIGTIVIGLALLFTFVLNLEFTGLVVFDQSTQVDFDEGAYVNTLYNGSAVVLSAANLTGTYTSKIFDAGEDNSWDSLTWTGNAPVTITNSLSSATHSGSPVTGLSAIDGNFSSINLTASSLQVNFTENLQDSSTLEIHARTNVGNGNVEVQNSTGGVLGNFIVTSATGENFSIALALVSSLNSIFLVGEAGNDSVIDLDFVSSKNPSGISLDFQTRACSDVNCTNSTFSAPADHLNSLGLAGRYFQYQASFTGTNSSPSVESVSITSSVVALSISEPVGIKDTNTIPLKFSTTGNPSNCQYSVEDASDNAIVIGNTTLTDCINDTTFPLGSNDADYILRLYATGPLGLVEDSSNFKLDTSSSSSSSSEEEEESSSSSSSETPSTTPSGVEGTSSTPSTEITASDVGTISSGSGSSSENIQWTVSNTGTNSVSACAVKPLGDLALWISASEDTLNINSGESGTFLFDVVVPEGTADGTYTLSVSLECAETAASKDFTLEVITLEPEATSEGTTGTGFAIGGVGTGGIIIILVVVGILVTLLVVARRMRKQGKTLRSAFDSLKSRFYH